MTLIDHPSPNHSPRKTGVRVDTIILHHTASPSDERGTRSAVGWLSKAGSKASAHYVVGYDGKVYRLVPEDRTAWHAGLGRLPWERGPFRIGGRTFDPVYDMNHRSIGVELVNPGDGVTPFTEAQYLALGELLPDIGRRLGSRVEVRPNPTAVQAMETKAFVRAQQVWILGHRDVACFPDGRFGRKQDPADNFDWGRVRSMLAGSTHVA